LLTENAGTYRIWRSLVVTHGVQGVQVHDARLVSVMQAHGVAQILTLNAADFTRYSAVVTAISP
jgi:predicted nucleic acid-binding protein